MVPQAETEKRVPEEAMGKILPCSDPKDPAGKKVNLVPQAATGHQEKMEHQDATEKTLRALQDTNDN
jgi:hypothetical protein